MLRNEVGSCVLQDSHTPLVSKWVTSYLMMMSRDHQEPHAPFSKRTRGSVESHHLSALHVAQQQVDPIKRQVFHQTVDCYLACNMLATVTLPRQWHMHVVLGADCRLNEARVHSVELEI